MNSFLLGKKIAVLCGGPSSEREVSLRSGSAVANALRSLGADAFKIDVRDGNFHLPAGTELAFNALHGTFGEDGTIQAILEEKGIPYTGEGEECSRVAFDKIESKKRFVECGVPTAPYVTLQKGEIPDLPLPYVVKVPCQGSSVGVYLVKAMNERDRCFAKSVCAGRYHFGRGIGERSRTDGRGLGRNRVADHRDPTTRRVLQLRE